MRCLIADLITEVPAAGGMSSRCNDYLCPDAGEPHITIDAARYRPECYPGLDENAVAYLESGLQFAVRLLAYNGFYFHSSAVVVDGKAYLFSGDPTAGKSTHANLWLKEFPGAVIINDDKPALRRINGVWYAYGTPWCGKDGINRNLKAPVAGICFMKKAGHNAIWQLTGFEALRRVMAQTVYRFHKTENLDKMLSLLEQLLKDIPVYELENRPEPAAARLSYETMSRNQEDQP